MGSSITITRASRSMALRISTSCFSMRLSEYIWRAASMSRPALLKRDRRGQHGSTVQDAVTPGRAAAQAQGFRPQKAALHSSAPAGSSRYPRPGIVRRPERDAEPHAPRLPPGLGLDIARQDLHKRRLAGPILTDECMYLTGGHAKSTPCNTSTPTYDFRTPCISTWTGCELGGTEAPVGGRRALRIHVTDTSIADRLPWKLALSQREVSCTVSLGTNGGMAASPPSLRLFAP